MNVREVHDNGYGEGDRQRDVCDEDVLLSVVQEEAQCAGRRVEVDLQHRGIFQIPDFWRQIFQIPENFQVPDF
jgi:hypothetical protein